MSQLRSRYKHKSVNIREVIFKLSFSATQINFLIRFLRLNSLTVKVIDVLRIYCINFLVRLNVKSMSYRNNVLQGRQGCGKIRKCLLDKLYKTTRAKECTINMSYSIR